MKNILRLILYLVGFLVLCSICHADKKRESDTDIARKNDEIIRTVHASRELVFAIPPYSGQKSTRIGFKQLVKHLGNAINNNVTLVILKDYESMITRTMAGEVDIGFYGPSLYVKVKKNYPELKYLATVVWKTTNKHTYFSYLITKKGTGLRSLASLEGKTFAFGSKESTSGYMYPMAWMIENNLDSEKYYKSVKFLGSHNKVLDAVYNGKIDAGTVAPGPLKKKTNQYGHIYNRIRKFGPIPASVVAASHRIPDEIIKRIVKALVLLPVAVTNVEEFDYIGFKVLSDESYDRFRQVMELTK